MVVHDDEREREKERTNERWIESMSERYINKPREKTPKIIPTCEEINSWIQECAERRRGDAGKASKRGRVVPKRRLRPGGFWVAAAS